jgi:putative glycosyltransferase
MKVSVVSTMYYSAPYLASFYERVRKELAKLTDDHEILLVNDGSPDDSLERALELVEQDAGVVVVDLTRNFGHHRAILAGLEQARGDLIFVMDCDLEDDPAWLTLFHETMTAELDVDAVYGMQRRRKGGWFERWSGWLFYSLFNLFSGIRIPRNTTTARLLTRRFVDSLLRFRESDPFLNGIWHIVGYRQIGVFVEKGHKGTTTYSLRKKAHLLVTAITSFSNRPLVMIFYTGLVILVVSGLYIAYLLTARMFFDITVDGWTSLITSLWFLGGLTIFFLGVVGIYLSRIYTETKSRPRTLVREVYRRSSAEHGRPGRTADG